MPNRLGREDKFSQKNEGKQTRALMIQCAISIFKNVAIGSNVTIVFVSMFFCRRYLALKHLSGVFCLIDQLMLGMILTN